MTSIYRDLKEVLQFCIITYPPDPITYNLSSLHVGEQKKRKSMDRPAGHTAVVATAAYALSKRYLHGVLPPQLCPPNIKLLNKIIA